MKYSEVLYLGFVPVALKDLNAKKKKVIIPWWIVINQSDALKVAKK